MTCERCKDIHEAQKSGANSKPCECKCHDGLTDIIKPKDTPNPYQPQPYPKPFDIPPKYIPPFNPSPFEPKPKPFDIEPWPYHPKPHRHIPFRIYGKPSYWLQTEPYSPQHYHSKVM